MGKNWTDRVVPGRPSAFNTHCELARENRIAESNNSLMHRSNVVKISKAWFLIGIFKRKKKIISI